MSQVNNFNAPVGDNHSCDLMISYDGTLLTTFLHLDTAPNLEEVLNLLAGQISNEDMVEMTYQVDVLGRPVDDVAHQFLVSRGLLPG